ncbi:MAG: flippase-like domain-containing protein [Sedimentisphaerales bacterium]|nr:flippase-like domain-containing protein [Sedimentisphaerales bacterium]
MKRQTSKILWLAVSVIALGFLAYRTPRATFQQAVENIRWGWATAAVGIYLLAQTILAPRWVILLRVHAVQISMFQALKLTYLGLFYNNLMPGAVGGDLLKGWYITHHSDKDQRLQAAVTVFVDRLTGLIGMVMVAVLASFFLGGGLKITLWGRALPVRTLVWLIFAAMIVLGVLFLSRRVRSLLLLERLLEKLPFSHFLKRIDDAIRLYRRHLATMALALLITGLIQGLSIVAVWMLTRALQLEQIRFLQCLVIMPIVWLISAAIPVPGGLGVMENLFLPFFTAAMGPSAATLVLIRGQVAALALLNRLMICLCSLPGALVPIFGGHLPRPQQIEAELAGQHAAGEGWTDQPDVPAGY